jgi:hypothetical protein
MAEDEPGSSRSMPAHKILLAAGSTFFHRMFQSATGGKLSTVFLGEIDFKLVRTETAAFFASFIPPIHISS